MTDFAPFKNDSQSTTIGEGNGLTFENGTDSIKVYGDFEISKDSPVSDIEDIIAVLEAIKDSLAPKNDKKLKQ